MACSRVNLRKMIGANSNHYHTASDDAVQGDLALGKRPSRQPPGLRQHRYGPAYPRQSIVTARHIPADETARIAELGASDGGFSHDSIHPNRSDLANLTEERGERIGDWEGRLNNQRAIGLCHFLRWRIRLRIRRFLRPTLRRPLPRRRLAMRSPLGIDEGTRHHQRGPMERNPKPKGELYT
jgi:hypothetical protein